MIEKAYRTVWGIHNDWVAESVSGSRQNDSAFVRASLQLPKTWHTRPRLWHAFYAAADFNSAPGEISMRNCLKLLPSLRLLVPMATIGLIVASSTAFAAQEVKMVEHAFTITH